MLDGNEGMVCKLCTALTGRASNGGSFVILVEMWLATGWKK